MLRIDELPAHYYTPDLLCFFYDILVCISSLLFCPYSWFWAGLHIFFFLIVFFLGGGLAVLIFYVVGSYFPCLGHNFSGVWGLGDCLLIIYCCYL